MPQTPSKKNAFLARAAILFRRMTGRQHAAQITQNANPPVQNEVPYTPFVRALAAELIRVMLDIAPFLFQNRAAPAPEVRLLRMPEVAVRLGVCKRTVETLVAKGVFQPVRIGRAVRIPSSQVDAYIARGAQ